MTRRHPDQGESLVQKAMRAVTNHMRDSQLRVGDSLPGEGFFAEKVDVSRAVVREAFGALAALNLIDVGNGRRARVAAIGGSVIAASLDHAIKTAQITEADIWDVRRTVERRTAALAAACRTPEEADQISKAIEDMWKVRDDRARMTVHDMAFHMAIARASHNNLFVPIVESFCPLMEVVVPAAWKTLTMEDQREAMIERHRAIAAAIAKGDPELAAAAMDFHFDDSIRILCGISLSAPL